MKGKKKLYNTKGGARYNKACFYKNFMYSNSPYVPEIKRMRAKALELIRYLHDNVPFPVAINEATLFKEEQDRGMEYHCDNLKRDQKTPYVSPDLIPGVKCHGYGVVPPNKGEKDYWQPHHGGWLWGHALYRSGTALTYLNDDFEGGETRIPYYDIDVTPKPGRVVCFKGIPQHEHGVRPVSKGTRYTFVNWMTNIYSQRENKVMGITPYITDEWV